ncbi:hypothetical protein [Photorhabdus heterorhabditis]|uniref:hypothetical protein n=1 Tax=Photorhabdus heterorhabditis TaxID=880156 RepID=UPI001562B1DE|nr:hypothetical protein [Photorhabdus heterorhabditis]NRN27098.1 hypothetical protein [Photorhabdus heterorhabditis subsp. aluminescens]
MIQIPTPEKYKKGRVKFGKLLIRPLRKNAVAQITRYQVSDGEYSYGQFDSKEQAISFARQLYGSKINERVNKSSA